MVPDRFYFSKTSGSGGIPSGVLQPECGGSQRRLVSSARHAAATEGAQRPSQCTRWHSTHPPGALQPLTWEAGHGSHLQQMHLNPLHDRWHAFYFHTRCKPTICCFNEKLHELPAIRVRG